MIIVRITYKEGRHNKMPSSNPARTSRILREVPLAGDSSDFGRSYLEVGWIMGKGRAGPKPQTEWGHQPCTIPKLLSPEKYGSLYPLHEEVEPEEGRVDHSGDGERGGYCQLNE